MKMIYVRIVQLLMQQLYIERMKTERIEKFQDQIKSEFVYRIPLRFLCDLDLANQCFKFNAKYILPLETGMQRLFKTNVNQAADALPRTVDAEIIFTSAPYIMYEQMKLDNNYQTYAC